MLDQGRSLMVALSQDVSMNRPVEAREHVRRFHELFFTMAPDKAAIESNINRALFLCDKSAYSLYKDWSERGYYNRIIAANLTQTITIDSMACDFDRYPYRISTYAEQVIIRESNITRRSLITQCDLINTTRSDNNPQGFMIQHFEIVENKDIHLTHR